VAGEKDGSPATLFSVPNERKNIMERQADYTRLRHLEAELRQRDNQLRGLGQVPGEKRVKEFFTYQEDFAAIVSGASATGNINIQADSSFVLQKLTFKADIAAATQTANTRVLPNATVVITDTGSGRQLMESAVPITSLFGDGQLPFILPTPRLFAPRSTITVVVANYDAAATYNIQLSFNGYKLYEM
jgi:hypothetical protein